jgi:NADPH-dependent 2,4-dienoyl-CoA reductase/sulfur reductase-like enzyme
MSSKVEKIVPQADDPKLAGGVVVNGTTLPCDFVIMGVGVAPATQFLKGGAIQVERDGGVRVDEYLRVRSVPSGDVYAIGDIAIYPQQDGSETRIEHWNVGNNDMAFIFLLLERFPR